ncbi:MAG TPA: family 1 glycosylhydrolase [Gaiellaceae bacterium]|nr:family 1 glycosylhydrolase [Gaiellaceae bacterium]
MSGAIPFVGAFESTYQPAFDTDGFETTRHVLRWRDDLELLYACGVREIRYPVRWHRIEVEPGSFDWDQTDEVLGYLEDAGIRVIVDLVHHTSYPLWIRDFADPAFGPALLRYVRAFAERYPGVEAYTIFNEPFTTFLLCGDAGIWPPRLRGLEGFVTVARNVFPALTEASRLLGELLPEARHVYLEVCERHSSSSPAGAWFAEWTNDRRFFLTDLFLGRELDRRRPFVADVIACGGADLLDIEAGTIDVLGLDYYAHNQWEWAAAHVGTTSPSAPASFAELIVEYWERYRLPCIVGETNIRGRPSDRATWLKYTLEQSERARDAGVPLEGYCWFPFLDSCDWDSILCRCDSSVDPVGVYSLDAKLNRTPSSMSDSYRLAASGTLAAELPAYELQRPAATWLAGWLPEMAHWHWEEPPTAELALGGEREDFEIEFRVVAADV